MRGAQRNPKVKPAERHVQQLLNDLGRALASVIADSADVTEAVERLRGEGYALTLVLNCEHAESGGAKVALSPPGTGTSAAGSPTFRVDGSDVAWLRSVGIDATRPAPRRRGT